ncbi:MAG: hypothetical protein IMF19_04410 [Proteobacteria bacterium]|nr:hypothetical protein [Pseudomonadota bacterium]
MANTGIITLPLLEIAATSVRPAPEYLGLAMRLNNLAVSQYCRYDFDSMDKFGDMYLGAGEEGLFTLEDAETDDGLDINAVVEFPTTDFGISHQKRIRSLHVGYETSGDLTVTINCDDDDEKEYTLAPINTSNNQHGGKVKINREQKGRYWTFRFENVDGADFSLNMIEAIATILARKPSGN